MEHKANLGVIPFDLDHLKQVNDLEGYERGDAYIVAAARLIDRCFSAIGRLYRIGGDEFVVLATETTEETIRDKIDDFHRCCQERNISVSCGYSFRADSFDLPQMLRDADQSMYHNINQILSGFTRSIRTRTLRFFVMECKRGGYVARGRFADDSIGGEGKSPTTKRRKKDMNQVYLTGIVADEPAFGANNARIALCVSHKSAKGEIKRETYIVRAWNNVAAWAKEKMRRGQGVAVHGYLTQHMAQTEITATEIFLRQAIETKERGETNADE